MSLLRAGPPGSELLTTPNGYAHASCVSGTARHDRPMRRQGPTPREARTPPPWSPSSLPLASESSGSRQHTRNEKQADGRRARDTGGGDGGKAEQAGPPVMFCVTVHREDSPHADHGDHTVKPLQVPGPQSWPDPMRGGLVHRRTHWGGRGPDPHVGFTSSEAGRV